MTTEITDVSQFCEPKSDRLNADDLIGGPITVTIAGVGRGPEDRLSVAMAGRERPWLPCKTMTRLLVTAWGSDPRAWVGRRVTLYRDPDAEYGGQRVGGVRVSELSHIQGPLTVQLTERRGKRRPWTVEPLATPTAKPIAEIVDMLAARYPAHADRIIAIADGTGTDDEKRAALRALAAEAKA